jgi:capsular polysaccharide transport system permease protein
MVGIGVRHARALAKCGFGPDYPSLPPTIRRSIKCCPIRLPLNRTDIALDANPSPLVLQDARPLLSARLRRQLRRIDVIFILTVLVPTLLAAIYYGLVASDVYISEARFVVRSPQRQTPTGLGALLQGVGFSRSQDDTYSVHDFIRSRDALRELDEKLAIRRLFSSEDIDFVNRFPLLGLDDSFEALHLFYQKHVKIEYDSVSSISVLSVRAYTAEDALRINDLLLQMGERLVNNLNERSRRDLIDVAKKEVALAEDRSKQAALVLSSYRTARSVFDPERQSTLQLQGVAKLQEELLAAEAQLAQVRAVSPNNPQVAALDARVAALRKTVADESGKVTGGKGSLTVKAPDFGRLVLDREFADRQLAAAMVTLESARSEAARKQLYLERLVQPNLADKAMEPRRVRTVLMVFVLGLVLWGVVSMVVASIKEHAE